MSLGLLLPTTVSQGDADDVSAVHNFSSEFSFFFAAPTSKPKQACPPEL